MNLNFYLLLKKKYYINIVTILFGAVIFLSNAQAQTLRWSSQGDILTLDPHAQNEALTNSVNGQVYETLLSLDKNLKLAPALATSWQQISPLVWRFKLRPSVQFHDGSALSADDVVFSINRAKESTSAIQVYANAVGNAKAVDAQTVEFTLPKLDPVFLSRVATIFIMNRAWSEKNNAAKPLDFKNKEVKFTSTHANGTGPFQLVSRAVDSKTTFKRNLNWWGSWEGNLQEVIYLPVKSDATRTAALLTGELDFLLDPVPQDIARLRNATDLKVLDGIENRIIFIGMDQSRDELLYSNIKGKNPFKDVRVRKALYHAVDIDAIKMKLMRGYSAPTGSMTPSPLGSFNDPQIEARLAFDLTKARNLLSEAGYEQGFEVALDCPNNRYINDEEICVALAAMWSQIGIKVKVIASPRTVYFAKAEKLDTSMFMLGWGAPITDAETVLTPVLRSRSAAGVGFFNWGNHKNAKLDELAMASSQEIDPMKREALIKAALLEHNEQAHHIPLHRQMIPWAMRRNVTVFHRADNWLEWRWVSIN
jgi:peptide/nickel transport system substrate-binding protein